MLDTPLMLWELSVTEQGYRAVLEVAAGVTRASARIPSVWPPGWALVSAFR